MLVWMPNGHAGGVKRFNKRAETHSSPIPKFLLFYFVRKLWLSLSLSVTKA